MPYSNAEFYEYIDKTGKRYLKYLCYTCNKYHVVRTSGEQSKTIRRAFNMVLKRSLSDDSQLILWCGKGAKPEMEGVEGISMLINPKNKIPKAERDMIDKRMQRAKLEIKSACFGLREEIESAKQVIEESINEVKSRIEREKTTIGDLERIQREIKAVEKI